VHTPVVLTSLDPDLRRRLFVIYGVLLLANLGAWAWAVLLFRDQPLLLGTALLAYGFGLRHAVDADHIAAIDNVTRKLMQDGQRPVAVGFFFALGHSTVVAVAAAGVAATATLLTGHFEAFKEIGGTIGTLVSGLFLFAIAPSAMSAPAAATPRRISTSCSTSAACWRASFARCSG
jgi:high-affinity nickel-transport protein